MTNGNQRLTANGLTKRAALGLAVVSCPVIFLVELVLAKKFTPNLFTFVGIGPSEAVAAASRTKELEMYTAMGIMFLASIFMAALIAHFSRKREAGGQMAMPEKKGDA